MNAGINLHVENICKICTESTSAKILLCVVFYSHTFGLNELIWVRIDLMGTWRFCNQRRRKLGVPTHLGCSGVHPFHCDIIILCTSLALLPLLAVDAAGGRGKHNKAVSWHG